MPSFLDSGVIILLVLILFGPKQLPVLARQFGKLMNDFRRASNEFRTQMEDELRISEQAERQKTIAAESAGTPAIEPAPAIDAETSDYSSHLPPNDPANDPPSDYMVDTGDSPQQSSYGSVSEPATDSTPEAIPSPLPIATSGELSILPPTTGLPTPNSEPALPEDPVQTVQATTETEALHS
jgi:sec-independent protein translocase protein TatB